MPEDLSTLDIMGGIARLTLNRPDTRNAMSIDLIESLHERVESLGTGDEPVRVVVITGAGKSFCAGMDLKEILRDEETPRRLLRRLADLTVKIRSLESVVVARVNGAAIGGGCGLAAVCDVAITHADSKMGFPEVDLGLCPAVVAPWVVRKIGPGRARSVLLRGGILTGERAHALGLVDELAPNREGLDELVDTIVSRLAEGGAEALAATKSLLNRLDGSDDEAMVRRGAELSADVVLSEQAQTALRARLS